jgi:diguanylate cyclase (GGDEF)-like protein
LLLDGLLAAEHRARKTRSKPGVIYLDPDDFKLINDKLGHEADDNILKDFSVAITGLLRASDCLARVGGEEFVILGENIADRADIAKLAEWVRAAITSKAVSNGISEPMRVSCGIEVFPDDGVTAHDVMREADTAMYHAK